MPEKALERSELRDIDAAGAGDEAAFLRLLQRHQPQVYRWMWHFSRDRIMVDELVQDVFVEVFRSLPTYAGRAPFVCWLRSIAMHVGYRHWRHRSRDQDRQKILTQKYLELLREAGPKEPSEAAECLYHLLELLPDKERLVLTMHYFEGYRTHEIAVCMGCSHTAVRVRAHRARQKLKRELLALGFGS